MAKAGRGGASDLFVRLKRAHRSMQDMAVYAGKLLQDIEQLKKDVACRDAAIAVLKESLNEAEAMLARAATRE
jgi:hypothetical protein